MKSPHDPARPEMTVDETNEAISRQVDQELPKPPGGFESDDLADEFRAAQEKRFVELVHNPALWTF